jgi:hypothetical protein
MASKSYEFSCGRPTRDVQFSIGGSTTCRSDNICLGCFRHSSISLRFPIVGLSEPFSIDLTSISHGARPFSSPSSAFGGSNDIENPVKCQRVNSPSFFVHNFIVKLTLTDEHLVKQ